MTRIMITGFEPFGGEKENPSAWIARNVKVPGAQLESLVLPVEFGRAACIAMARLEEFKPHWIVMLGQAAGRTAITPERIAINLAHSSEPDNAGIAPQEQAITPQGAAAYFTRLPVARILVAMEEAGVPAQVSNTAGTYVCNDLFYRVMACTEGTATRAGFIHIPLFPAQALKRAQPSMDPQLTLKGINAALAVVMTEAIKDY